MLAIFLSITGFIRTLLLLIMFYLILRTIAQILNHRNNSKQSQTKRDEGEIILRYNKKGERIKTKKEGEFVDYEEVD